MDDLKLYQSIVNRMKFLPVGYETQLPFEKHQLLRHKRFRIDYMIRLDLIEFSLHYFRTTQEFNNKNGSKLLVRTKEGNCEIVQKCITQNLLLFFDSYH